MMVYYPLETIAVMHTEVNHLPKNGFNQSKTEDGDINITLW